MGFPHSHTEGETGSDTTQAEEAVEVCTTDMRKKNKLVTPNERRYAVALERDHS